MACCPRMENWMRNILDSSYCTFLMSLFATILSFADPVTDILTLVEFYREDHKTWFAVGLIFVILPCVPFLLIMRDLGTYRTENYLCGFNPSSFAWVRLKICWTNFRKFCWEDNSNDDNEDLNDHSNVARLVEAALESAPQFIIQLYAMTVQQEPVKIIQMISLPVSFLSLVWAFTACDTYDGGGIVEDLKVKQKVVLFVAYLFLLSSRLFAVTFFTITYKWWIISVLMIHNVLVLIVVTIWSYRITARVFRGCSSCRHVFIAALIFCFNWLKDDMSLMMQIADNDDDDDTPDEEEARFHHRMATLANILFVIENSTMILIFYLFSPFSNTLYSLPVTVCVCSFSVFGAVTRVAYVYFEIIIKESNPNNANSPVQQKDNTAEVGNRNQAGEFSL